MSAARLERKEALLTLVVDVEGLRAISTGRASAGGNAPCMTPEKFRNWVKHGTPTYADQRHSDQKR